MPIAEPEVQTEVKPKVEKEVCPSHGLRFNPLIAICPLCREAEEQSRQAKIAIYIVAFVLLAVITVMVQVLWAWWSQEPPQVSNQRGTASISSGSSNSSTRPLN